MSFATVPQWHESGYLPGIEGSKIPLAEYMETCNYLSGDTREQTIDDHRLSIPSPIRRSSSYRATSNESTLTRASDSTSSSPSKRSRPYTPTDAVTDRIKSDLDQPDKRPRKSVPVNHEQSQLFACPFAKYNPSRYSASNLQELNYRGCSQCYLTDVSRVKQHLYRVHARPRFYCSRCFKEFKWHEAFVGHVSARSCLPQPCPFEEKMTSDQLSTIKKKNRGVDPYSLWCEIYSTLFPHTDLPSSPYATFVNPGAVSLNVYTDFVEHQLPGRLHEQLSAGSLHDQAYQSVLMALMRAHLGDAMREVRRDFDESLQSGQSSASYLNSSACMPNSHSAGRRKSPPPQDVSFLSPSGFHHNTASSPVAYVSPMSGLPSSTNTQNQKRCSSGPGIDYSNTDHAHGLYQGVLLSYAPNFLAVAQLQNQIYDPITASCHQRSMTVDTAAEEQDYYSVQCRRETAPSQHMLSEDTTTWGPPGRILR